MNTIKVPYKGRGCRYAYQVETIELGLENLPYLNVYLVVVEDEEVKKILGDQFTILHHPLQLTTPVFAYSGSNNLEEKNLKKQIAQQILNNPTE